MSIFGFDLLDHVHMGRYMSDNEEEESRCQSSAAQTTRNDISTWWNQNDTSSDTTSQSRQVPGIIELLSGGTSDDLLLDETQSEAGLTILSSVPSQDVYTAPPPPPHPTTVEIYATCPLVVDHALSISTTESLYQYPPRSFYTSASGHASLHSLRSASSNSGMSASSSAVLSMPSSLASSVELWNSRDLLTGSLTPGAAVSVDTQLVRAVAALATTQQLLAPTATTSPQQLQQQLPVTTWYAHFTQDDWEQFHQETMHVLTALTDDPALQGEQDRDMVLARLIQQEEDVFWNGKRQGQRRRGLQLLHHCSPAVLLNVAACMASAAVASLGTAVLMTQRQRR